MISLLEITIAEASLASGILSLIGVIIVAVIANKGRKFAKSADDAVNHAKERGSPTIAELIWDNHKKAEEVAKDVREIREWKRSYAASPWQDGESVNVWIADNQSKLDALAARAARHEGVCAEARKTICKAK